VNSNIYAIVNFMTKYTVFVIYCFPEPVCSHGMSWHMQACYAVELPY
jgi:hypothetical protein